MIIVKFAILLTALCVLMLIMFRGWCLNHPLKALVEDYPWWAYVYAILIPIDVLAIFASMIWFLFCFL
jgi:hypothetical protein